MSRAEDIFQKLIYFGEDAIDEFILNQQTEELFLDFKQAVSVGKNFTTLHRDDRKNLSKAISGFGNSEGGVIIWGVECSRDIEIGDVAKAKVKVKNVHRFLSWLENAISGCTIPSHNKVRNHIISCDANGDGFIATYIPKCDIAPAGCRCCSDKAYPHPYFPGLPAFGCRPSAQYSAGVGARTFRQSPHTAPERCLNPTGCKWCCFPLSSTEQYRIWECRWL